MMTRAEWLTLAGKRRRPRRYVAIALLLTLGSQLGCGREFYREWANQDVSEAVFEKSRDPRYRLDIFSIEPPALARFADPYDPDRPPAPPDDFAAQSLSPVPQWPDHRLIMPVEGTGYLKILDEGPRYDAPPPKVVKPPAATPPARPSSTPPPPPTPSPFSPGSTPPGLPSTSNPGPNASRTNFGPKSTAMSPISLAASPSTPARSPATQSSPSMPPAATVKPVIAKDDGLRRTAIQVPAVPVPAQGRPVDPVVTPPSSTETAPGDPIQTPKIPGDPKPTDDNLSIPSNPRRDLSPDQYRQSEETASNLAKMFVPEDVAFNEAIAVGLPSNSRPYVLTMEKALQLAIMNSRTYQTQLEAMYLNALPVTLQRFSFGPQFIAGLSPRTGVGGAGSSVLGGILPTQSFPNSFLYNTRATGAQQSALNLGTVAGVGKLFNNGTQVLASFANQVVFNFIGKNPAQPTVRSFLPFQMIVPFLRGGGRAITLEGLTQAERSLLYSIRVFAKFRQEFVVATLTGGTIQTFGVSTTTGGFTTGGNIDPTIGFLNVVEDIQVVENQVKNLAVFEQFVQVYRELIQGESSGLSQLQLDQVRQQVQNARTQLLGLRLTYRNDMDQYKIQLGMPPDVPVVIDRTRTAGFRKVYAEIDKWSLNSKRELEELDFIVARLPKLEDIVIDGRSCVEVFSQEDDRNLEDLLKISERVAFENRLDLMNSRAQLYDTWRQIRVSANALKGILNVAVTNQFLTPPTTNNPFGFVDQAKQFSLVINAELPLVRVAERNNFRTQLINYQRQRRTLQNTEDFIKNQLRQEIRQMQVFWQQYYIAQRNLALSVRLKDQAFETIVAPPAGTAGGQAALQTTNLINFQNAVVQNENNLVSIWYTYQLQRLQVYRDLGTLPIDEWEAFDEIFPPDRSGGGYAAAVGPDGRTAVARPADAASPVRRN